MEHLDILRLNGFDVLVNEDADVGERVKLIAQPVSKDTVFGAEGTLSSIFGSVRADSPVSDLEELLELIKSSSSSEVVRPSKARKMFASRACRKSVMFGKPLNTNQMTTVSGVGSSCASVGRCLITTSPSQIVRHMGGMDQPWVRFRVDRCSRSSPLSLRR
jgi:DNA mismatch repair protein PMS2